MHAACDVLLHHDVLPLITTFQHGLLPDILAFWKTYTYGADFWASLDLPVHAINRRVLGDVRDARYQLLVLVAANKLPLVRQLLRCRPSYLAQPGAPHVIDVAAAFGRLDMVQYFHTTFGGGVETLCSTQAMDLAAKHGFPDVVQYLHVHRTEGCTDAAMIGAATHGHLDIVRFLHEHRSDASTPRHFAIDFASTNGHLHVVEYLHAVRQEGGSTWALDTAAGAGHFDVVKFLHAHHKAGCTVAAMDTAAANGHLPIVQYLHRHRHEGCTTRAMDSAAKNNHLRVVEFLHTHRREGCTEKALHMAAQNGHTKMVEFLTRHRRRESNLVDAAVVAKRQGHGDCVALIHRAAMGSTCYGVNVLC
ncbi:Aste57867_16532 [Aphanomyces stellatus]|uniref:Aste57867_16532 protein n=1 Tax=Aphanomyces stellatus TaxID=120398 RepID=A0A485L7K3_9STRA|nr:hypothetical protein As57867_016475 [Aphanomyces stellatus]VFT93306.1 Aste57867_16532 [Aphanomyces stellatus]